MIPWRAWRALTQWSHEMRVYLLSTVLVAKRAFQSFETFHVCSSFFDECFSQ